MKGIGLAMILTLGITSAVAQEGRCPRLPKNYHWQDSTDYQKDRDLVVRVLKWLCQTPLAIDVRDRSLANAFVLEYLAGTPELRMVIKTGDLPFYPDHPELLYPFMHGMALYMLGHPAETSEIVLYSEGFSTVALLSSQSKQFSSSPSLSALLKAHRRKKITQYTELVLEKAE